MNKEYNSCVEGCSLPSSPNDIKILLNSIKREVDELVKTTEAKLLYHDGKIAELTKYVKDNLSNSIRCLLDSMKLSGELDDIILQTITDIKDLVLPVGNVKTYKAYGDGLHDDTNAIKKAIEDSIKYKVKLVIPDGTYKISEEIDARNIDIECSGNITGNTLIVGGSSQNGIGHIIELRDCDSVKVVGLKNSTVRFKSIDDLYLYANGDVKTDSSIAYNHFDGVVCNNVKFYSEGKEIGWINENVFNIKRISNILMDGNYEHNNNHFLHCNLEGSTIEIKKGNNNHFSARCEGNPTIIGNVGQTNFIEKEYYYTFNFPVDTKEEDGIFTYYPVNKIQETINLLKLDYGCKDYIKESVNFNEDGTFNPVRYASIYETNLVPIDQTFAIRVRSDQKVFRLRYKFYDENKNPIITEVDNFMDSICTYKGQNVEWNYSTSVNVNSENSTFIPGKAKYMKMNVIFGDNVADIDTNYLHIDLVKIINKTIHIANKL